MFNVVFLNTSINIDLLFSLSNVSIVKYGNFFDIYKCASIEQFYVFYYWNHRNEFKKSQNNSRFALITFKNFPISTYLDTEYIVETSACLEISMTRKTFLRNFIGESDYIPVANRQAKPEKPAN